LDQFESISINKDGFGQGPFGSGGIIALESRRKPLYEKDNDGMFTSIDVKEGYNEIKKYTNPNYTSYNSEMFKRLGSIAWFPNIEVQGGTQNNNSVDLKVVDTKLKEGIIYIEGISEDGQLHSYSIPIKLNNN
jgi:pyruvate-formate lyase